MLIKKKLGYSLLVGCALFSTKNFACGEHEKAERLLKLAEERVVHTVYDPDSTDAVIALGLTKEVSAIPRLLELYQSLLNLSSEREILNHQNLRLNIVKSLGWIGHSSTFSTLVNILENDPYEHCRASAALAIKANKVTEAKDALIKAAKNDSDRYVRDYAKEALQALGFAQELAHN